MFLARIPFIMRVEWEIHKVKHNRSTISKLRVLME